MSNFIINGDFSDGFSAWNNGVGGGSAYALDSGKARGSSWGSDERYYKMSQPFSLNDEPISGKATVWCKWQSYDASGNGYNRFIVNLVKPDLTSVNLLDTTKTAITGEGYLLNDYNILAHLDQYGNYALQLFLKTKGTQNPSPPPELFFRSYGWYDNISVDIAVKKYKTVHEKLGSSGRLGGKASVSRSEIIGLSESYSTEVYSPTFNYETASESVGLSEAYSILTKKLRNAAESVGLKEALQAKRIQGNLETTYVLQDLTQWTQISRVSTPWIKKKIEV